MLILLVVLCLDEFFLVIMCLINCFMKIGYFFCDWKEGFVIFLFKLFGLFFDFKNLCFISNL